VAGAQPAHLKPPFCLDFLSQWGMCLLAASSANFLKQNLHCTLLSLASKAYS